MLRFKIVGMSTKEIVRSYFAAIHKGGWESYIADDFTFVSSNLDKVARGKAPVYRGRRAFFRLTTSVEVRQLIVDGNTACAVARYRLRSPKGNVGVCDVAEILTLSDGKLNSSKILFDTTISCRRDSLKARFPRILHRQPRIPPPHMPQRIHPRL